jgi:membrane protein implicated in regulation of membrane protease activity
VSSDRGGAGAVAVGAAWALWTSDAPPWLRIGATAAASGLAILLGAAVRARLRTRGLDPYRDVVR